MEESFVDNISELSIEDNISEDFAIPIGSSSPLPVPQNNQPTDGEHSSTREYSTPVTLEICDSGELETASQSTQAQSEIFTCSSQSSYKKIPELNEYFTRSRLMDGRAENTCKSCGTAFKTKEMTRLMNHVKKCPLLEKHRRDVIVDKIEGALSGEKQRLNLLWTSVIVENNIPIKCVESRSFKKFAREVAPKWKVATRHQLSELHVPILAKNTEVEFMKRLCNTGDPVVSVEFDHWQDANTRSILAVILTMVDGSRYLCDLVDVSVDGHSSDVTVEKVKICLEKVPSRVINSFVSDSASVCKRARQLLVQKFDYYHVIQHRCMAHLLNRIGTQLTTKHPELFNATAWASKLASIVSNSPLLQAKIKESNMNRVKSACPVRWYSTITMFESLIQVREVIVEELGRSTTLDRGNLVSNTTNWSIIERACQFLRPLAHCIAVSERKQGSLGESVRAILMYARKLFANDWNDQLSKAAITAFLDYYSIKKMGREEFGVLLAAYALDRRSRLHFLTEDAIDLVLETVLEIAAKTGLKKRLIDASLTDEFDSYCLGLDDYSETACDSENAVQWWTRQSNSGSLRRIAMRFAYLRASSANIERTFSTLKYIQGSNRLNLSLENMKNLASIKISNSGDYDSRDMDDWAQPEDDFNHDRTQRELLLAQSTKESYDEFTRYICFSKLNQSSTVIRVAEEVPDKNDIEQLVKRSRATRAQLRPSSH